MALYGAAQAVTRYEREAVGATMDGKDRITEWQMAAALEKLSGARATLISARLGLFEAYRDLFDPSPLGTVGLPGSEIEYVDLPGGTLPGRGDGVFVVVCAGSDEFPGVVLRRLEAGPMDPDGKPTFEYVHVPEAALGSGMAEADVVDVTEEQLAYALAHPTDLYRSFALAQGLTFPFDLAGAVGTPTPTSAPSNAGETSSSTPSSESTSAPQMPPPSSQSTTPDDSSPSEEQPTSSTSDGASTEGAPAPDAMGEGSPS